MLVYSAVVQVFYIRAVLGGDCSVSVTILGARWEGQDAVAGVGMSVDYFQSPKQHVVTNLRRTGSALSG